jgi:hypothetical protein
VCRANRPNTWLHRPACKREENPCQLGAVHTWHIHDITNPGSDLRAPAISDNLFLMANPWDVPKPEPLGDRDENVLYAAVGRALSQWETVETACARIYAFLIGAPTDELTISPALRSFGIVNSFPTRCEMITTAGKAYFHLHPEVANYEKWINEALSDAKEFSNRRNEIAHGVVRHIINPTRESEGSYLCPSFFNPKKFPISMIPTYQYVEKNILYFSREFTKMGWKLEAMLRLLMKEPLTKPSEQSQQQRSYLITSSARARVVDRLRLRWR